MVKENSFITIQAFMVNELNLKGNELLIYAIIHGFSQDGESEFTGSLQYLADWTNSTKQGVMKALKSLCEKQLILKNETFQNNLKFCTYKVSQYATKFNGVLNKVTRGYETKFNGGIKQSLPNNINNNITDNKEYKETPPAYIQEKIPVIKAEIQPFLVDCFNKINLHNSKKKNIIPIEKDLFYFETGKGRGFVELAKQYDLDELKSAFENYLFVAESDTWKNSFSLNAFYKNVVEYIPSNFDMTRYVDMPKGGLNQLIEERMNADFSNGCTYRISTFVYHKKEWFNMGMPKGKELEALVKHWLSEDEKNGVDYSALNDDYYDYIKGAKND
ncbi:MAG: helix-turn-helix domain-containing protein [Methanobrevibacter sp.]|nr:helix-turn-helix domain-containing protein [Methanobrevibacter sp.]